MLFQGPNEGILFCVRWSDSHHLERVRSLCRKKIIVVGVLLCLACWIFNTESNMPCTVVLLLYDHQTVACLLQPLVISGFDIGFSHTGHAVMYIMF